MHVNDPGFQHFPDLFDIIRLDFLTFIFSIDINAQPLHS
jgi:hypothetical protein